MKQVIILGSTGSIGENSLDVIFRNKDKFRVLGLSAHSNTELLLKQIDKFSPEYVAIGDIEKARILEKKIKGKTKVLKGECAIENLLDNKSDLVVMAISGSGALLPVLKALEKTKAIALANKEALVMAGPLIVKKAKEKKVKIIPVDSEQSAIFQCLKNEDKATLKKVYLTASGGPLKDMPEKRFSRITPDKALDHPRWRMGRKISIDSATLMNKGLELIEAMYLFGLKSEEIEILIHPEAIIHSMVEFIDGVVLAQLAVTDMRIPIQYALTYPERINSGFKNLDFTAIKKLTFAKPDFKKFPCLRLAKEASLAKGSAPCVLNAVNEEAVCAFLDRRISFIEIAKIIEKVLERHRVVSNPGLEEILKIDAWARNEVKCYLS
ncbi:MAG: 1-deoxy-D-xylulose-5-phosphate reductoisomerase [Candidatus Omnitrophota bacterium]|nr:1-deoxy-D-xylulose-5-phosphate reductoisomerase [Candidatus Omnitrophota bacterium]